MTTKRTVDKEKFPQAGTCTEGHPITDAPETGHRGYQARFPRVNIKTKEIIPSHKITLCRVHYVEELVKEGADPATAGFSDYEYTR